MTIPAASGFKTFLDVPQVTELQSLEADIAFLGIPYGVPYTMGQSWTFDAPRYLRRISSRFRRSLIGGHNFDFGGELLDGRDVRLVDCGDVPGNPMDIPATVQRATDTVKTILSRGGVPFIFGGDDSIPIPVVRAYEEYGPIVVVQVDQHLDFKDDVNGIREGYSSPMRRISEMAWVEQVVQIGLSGVGGSLSSDLQEARAAGHLLFGEREVHDRGMQAILDEIPDAADYFITMDVDGLDVAIMPACSDPEPGGLSFAEAVDLLRGLAAKGRVVGMDLVEFTPEHDLFGLGARTAGRLILNLINAMVRAEQFDRT